MPLVRGRAGRRDRSTTSSRCAIPEHFGPVKRAVARSLRCSRTRSRRARLVDRGRAGTPGRRRRASASASTASSGSGSSATASTRRPRPAAPDEVDGSAAATTSDRAAASCTRPITYPHKNHRHAGAGVRAAWPAERPRRRPRAHRRRRPRPRTSVRRARSAGSASTTGSGAPGASRGPTSTRSIAGGGRGRVPVALRGLRRARVLEAMAPGCPVIAADARRAARGRRRRRPPARPATTPARWTRTMADLLDEPGRPGAGWPRPGGARAAELTLGTRPVEALVATWRRCATGGAADEDHRPLPALRARRRPDRARS